MTPELNNRRFSDKALKNRIPSTVIYEHDLTGATLKMLQLFNKNVPCDQVDEYIGKRHNPAFGEYLESKLSSDAKHNLLGLLDEATSKIDDVRRDITRSFKINSEMIRLVILEELKSPQNSRLHSEINTLSSDAFNQVVMYARQTLQKRLRLLEG